MLLAESQMNIPQATSVPVEMRNSTHMGIRNDERTGWFLQHIFEGNSGEFFQTPVKDN